MRITNILAASAAMLMAGCTTRIGDFTIYSTKNIDVKKSLHTVDTSRRVTGRDAKYLFVFIPLGQPNLKEAADNAEQKVPECVGLSDVAVRVGGWWAILTGQTWIEIEGNPIFEVKDQASK